MAGADVLTQTPEIRAWLLSLAPDKQMVVGSYIYLDGCASLHGLRLRLRLALRLRLGSYICLDGCARVRFGLTLPSSYPHGPGVPRTVNRSFICAESSAWRTDSKCSESPARSNLWTDPFHSTPALHGTRGNASLFVESTQEALTSQLFQQPQPLAPRVYIREKHVRAAAAMDAIAADVCSKRKGTALAYLASPATCYPIPAAAAQDAVDRLGAPPWSRFAACITALVKHGTHVPGLRARERAKMQQEKVGFRVSHSLFCSRDV